MNRRSFLKSLAAFCGAVTLPLEAFATVPDAVIDGAWRSTLDNPVVFYVRDYGALTTQPFYDSLPDPDQGDEDGYLEDSGQQSALAFFQAECEYNNLLGIHLIEEDAPGSDYYVAELRGSINDANALAEQHGIPIRFAWLGF